MKLSENMIGKYVTRTSPCLLGRVHGEEIKDYSYIGDRMKLLSMSNDHIRVATRYYKTTLDERWIDDNWKEYEELIDFDNLDKRQLLILREGLKMLLKNNLKDNFKKLNDITKLGLKIEKQIKVLEE